MNFFILSIVAFIKGHTVNSLNKKKSKILGIFTDAVRDLTVLSEQQEQVHFNIAKKKADLEEEENSIIQAKEETQRVISKITEFVL
jgi:hypothetical protein